MYSFQSAVAILLAGALALPGFAQTPEVTRMPSGHGWFSWLSRDYLAHTAPRISFEDSTRLDRLMRAGNIYLSLRDAIALALENNLDIENARFNLPQAESNLLRASAGQILTNVSNSISGGPSSASSGVLAGAQWVRHRRKLFERLGYANRRAERTERAIGRVRHSGPRSGVFPVGRGLALYPAADQYLRHGYQLPGDLESDLDLRISASVPDGHHRDTGEVRHPRLLAKLSQTTSTPPPTPRCSFP